MISAVKTFLWQFKRKQVSSTYKPVILVTGCSSGIGLALASALYDCPQYRVIITARFSSITEHKHTFSQTERFWIRELDVTDSKLRLDLLSEIDEKFGGVDILINNAGVCYRAALEDMSELDERRQMATNYLGPMELIKLTLPGMREKGRGKIINISSVSGMLAMPTMASYSASKHALEGASEALWYETKPFGINVSLVQPGFVRSKSFEQ
jgi:short-subunit dehydrogenase